MTTLSIEDLKAWLAELNDTREPCAACSGTGLAANMAGEPDECRTCHGNTVAPPEEQMVETATIALLIEGYIAMAEAIDKYRSAVSECLLAGGVLEINPDSAKWWDALVKAQQSAARVLPHVARSALNIGGTND